MRAPLIRLGWLLSLLVSSSSSAVTMEWTFIGDPGNAPDPEVMWDYTTGYGSVEYEYSIGTYEVTNAQYTEFLNAKAASDPLGLYNMNMFFDRNGGINRSFDSPGNYTYSTIAGRENWPVNFVSFYDALRFVNWLNNGQGNGDTETGAYTLLGGTPTPSNGTTVTRNPGATIFLTSENEWYKAAYYDPDLGVYYDHPAGSDTWTTCSAPTAEPLHANCGGDSAGSPTPVGSYTGSASPYGTFDQGGNVWEWNEGYGVIQNRNGISIDTSRRAARGGSYFNFRTSLDARERSYDDPTRESGLIGFRLVVIPEPGTGLLVIAGLLGLAGWRSLCPSCSDWTRSTRRAVRTQRRRASGVG